MRLLCLRIEASFGVLSLCFLIQLGLPSGIIYKDDVLWTEEGHPNELEEWMLAKVARVLHRVKVW